MRIITQTCTECGTIVAANELESKRVMKCPGLGCESVLRFEDLAPDEQEHFLENRDRYDI
jgi:hypothetical protein